MWKPKYVCKPCKLWSEPLDLNPKAGERWQPFAKNHPLGLRLPCFVLQIPPPPNPTHNHRPYSSPLSIVTIATPPLQSILPASRAILPASPGCLPGVPRSSPLESLPVRTGVPPGSPRVPARCPWSHRPPPVYRALLRCRAELNWLLTAPCHASSRSYCSR
jgi:hypothetical protein